MGEDAQPSGPDQPPMRAQNSSEVQDWPGCFVAVLEKEARETLVAAPDAVSAPPVGATVPQAPVSEPSVSELSG
jgi:hypothetical protein